MKIIFSIAIIVLALSTFAISPANEGKGYYSISGNTNDLDGFTSSGYSFPADSATASPSIICPGSQTNLNVSGGSLGTGANWYWYSGSCGGIYAGTGSSLILNPSLTTIYYLRAEGTMNTTSCVSVTVAIATYSSPALTGTCSSPIICPFDADTLIISGGYLGSNGNWKWYTGSCGGIYCCAGTTIVFYPNSTAIYYVRAESMCNTTTCISLTMNVYSQSIRPASISRTPSVVCAGSPDTLLISGGALGFSAGWSWYTGSCGGTLIATGQTITIIPTLQNMYYVRAEGFCSTTLCTTARVILANPSPPSPITATPSSICGSGAVISLNAVAAGCNIRWWDSPSGGNLLGSSCSGNNFHVSPPLGVTTYYAEPYYLSIYQSFSNYSQPLTYTVPVGVQYFNVSAMGGSGGFYNINNGIPGSSGSVFTTLSVSPGQVLHIYVGGVGSGYYPGWNGGGNAGAGSQAGGGGGATDIRIGGSSLSNRVLVAGGGGGAGYSYYGSAYDFTGGGGGFIGGNGSYYGAYSAAYCGEGGNQTAGGAGATLGGGQGTPGLGGDGYGGGAGGGGYFGGGGAYFDGGGGGGSSWVDTTLTSNTSYSGGYSSASGTLQLSWTPPVCPNTPRTSISVSIDDTSISAILAIASPSTLCSGSSSTLYPVGGYTGTLATWRWYTNSCGGTFAGSGISPVLTPTVTTTYWVRAEGICNTTTCTSTIISVNQVSYAATSVIPSSSIICLGDTLKLAVAGGYTGNNASWHWYSISCGMYPEGTGDTITVNPTVSLTFYVRAEGLCNTTGCVSSMIIVTQNSVQASSLIASSASSCSGTGDTLSVSGGFLAIGANWHWYTVSCGGIYSGTNSSIIIYPTLDSLYYARAEGLCNTTACLSIIIIINSQPVAPLSVTTDRNNYCSNAGGNIVLSSSGGSGQKIVWYRISCGGTLVGTGNPKSITAPASSTKYWARWETSGCSGSTCESVAVTVLTSSTIPASVSSSNYSLCNNSGGTITLTGSGGTGTAFGWYTGSCGGTGIGTGRILTVPSPTLTSTYWGRNQTVSCGNSSCKSLVVSVVSSVPVQPDTIIGNTFPGAGGTETYSVTSIPGITFTWTAPTGWSGTSVSNSITYIVGSGSGFISVIPSNGCGSGPIRTLDVSTGNNISGNFTYDNLSGTPLDSVWVFLMQNGSILDSIQADINGYYYFNKVQNGAYNITAKTNKPSGGVNATDAVKVKRHFSGSEYINTSIRLHAADVNMSFDINTTDAVKITRRFAGSDLSFTRGDWVFEKPSGGDTVNVSVYPNDTVMVNGNSVVQDFEGLCVGDVNCSNVPLPGAKSSPKIILNSAGTVIMNAGEELDLPVFVSHDMSIGAISLILNYPGRLISIMGIQPSHVFDFNNFFYKIIDDEIRIGWFESDGAIYLSKGDTLLTLKLKSNIINDPGEIITFSIKNDPLCEFADEKTEPFESVTLITNKIEYNTDQGKILSNQGYDFIIYPNPSKGNFILHFNFIPGNSSINIYNALGELILRRNVNSSSLIDSQNIEIEYPDEGIYFVKFLNDNATLIRKVIIAK